MRGASPWIGDGRFASNFCRRDRHRTMIRSSSHADRLNPTRSRIDGCVAVTDGRHQLPALGFGAGRVERIDPAQRVVEGFAAPDHLRDDEPAERFADAALELFLEERSSVTQEGDLATREAELVEHQPHQLMALRPAAAVPIAAREKQQPGSLR